MTPHTLEPDPDLEPFFLSPQPLMILSFLVGIVVCGGGVNWFRTVKRRGRSCARCASTTISLIPGFPLRLLGKGYVTRWCPDCDWTGTAFRPTHERRGRGGKIRMKGAFRWGRPISSPSGFFEWSGPERRRSEQTAREAGANPPAEDQERPLPGFQWREERQPSKGAGFNWGRGRAQLQHPPRFYFAEKEAAPEKKPPEDPGDSWNRAPRLGFRWKG